MRRTAALAIVLGLAVAPSASAVNVVKCVTDNNRIGFPYGGYDLDPKSTVNCIHAIVP